MIIPIIAGATATGKTKISIELAKKINGEIISCDSMQIYKGMDIGTAKVTEEEKENILHYMIDVIEPDQFFSVSDFKDKVEEYIEKIIEKGKTPILVGGTGLYINNIVYGIKHFEETIEDREKKLKQREKYNQIAETEEGLKKLYEKAKKIDPLAIDKISPNDSKRIIRILEIYNLTGKNKTEIEQTNRKQNKYEYKIFVLDLDRKYLYEKINKRVDQMFEEGLIFEVEKLQNKLGETSKHAIGYKEFFEYFNEVNIEQDQKKEKEEQEEQEEKEIKTFSNLNNEDIFLISEKIKRNSRRYAKRQFTWFRRNDAFWLDVNKLHDLNDLSKDNKKNKIEYQSQSQNQNQNNYEENKNKFNNELNNILNKIIKEI